MSHIHNEEFLERSLDQVREACEVGDFEAARNIVSDVREYGFSYEAARLEKIIRSSKVEEDNANQI